MKKQSTAAGRARFLGLCRRSRFVFLFVSLSYDEKDVLRDVSCQYVNRKKGQRIYQPRIVVVCASQRVLKDWGKREEEEKRNL